MSQLTPISPGAALPLRIAGSRAETASREGLASGEPRRSPRRRSLAPWLYLIVPLAFLLTFTYVPAANLIWYSFTSWDGFDQTKTYVGFDNYISIFSKPQFFAVFFVSLYYIGASVVQLVVAMYFATILSFKTRFRSVFKGVLFFPYLLNGVAIGFIFLYLYQAGGTLDTVLNDVGLSALKTQWLGNSHAINFSLAATSIWRYMGLNFVLFLGAIQSIPEDVYEAAELDGANSWQRFRYIIAPSIRRIISLSFILAIAGSLSVFEIPFIMTGGSNGSTTFVIQTVQTAFVYHLVGLASAFGVVLLVIVIIVTFIQRRLVPDEKSDEDGAEL
jgi:ABC-type sugar transport system permease subunit